MESSLPEMQVSCSYPVWLTLIHRQLIHRKQLQLSIRSHELCEDVLPQEVKLYQESQVEYNKRYSNCNKKLAELPLTPPCTHPALCMVALCGESPGQEFGEPPSAGVVSCDWSDITHSNRPFCSLIERARTLILHPGATRLSASPGVGAEHVTPGTHTHPFWDCAGIKVDACTVSSEAKRLQRRLPLL